MANVDVNAITQHFRGKVGDLVFKRLNGRLIAGLRPRERRQAPTPAQEQQQLEFAKAISYAKAMLADPGTRSVYTSAGVVKRQGAFPTAVGDYLKPPTVQDIDVSGYRGRAGDLIVVRAVDDVEVVGVTVTLRDGLGAVIEQGAATYVYNQWLYTAATTLAAGAAVSIEVTARDRPGNTGVKTLAYA